MRTGLSGFSTVMKKGSLVEEKPYNAKHRSAMSEQ